MKTPLLSVDFRMKTEIQNMEKIAGVFGKRQFICSAAPVKSEQIVQTHSQHVHFFIILICHLKASASIACLGEILLSLSFLVTQAFSCFRSFREKTFPLYFCILHLHF